MLLLCEPFDSTNALVIGVDIVKLHLKRRMFLDEQDGFDGPMPISPGQISHSDPCTGYSRCLPKCLIINTLFNAVIWAAGITLIVLYPEAIERRPALGDPIPALPWIRQVFHQHNANQACIEFKGLEP
nr:MULTISPECIES: hypothetical protein [unclassified Pseudomonas]